MDNTFLTYLDQKSLNALIANGLVGRNDWAEFRREAIAALTSPSDSVKGSPGQHTK